MVAQLRRGFQVDWRLEANDRQAVDSASRIRLRWDPRHAITRVNVYQDRIGAYGMPI
jgi:hypothetical protein